MKHVSILIPRGNASLTNIEGTHHLMSEVNGMLVRAGKAQLFDVHLVGLSDQSDQRNGLFTIKPDQMAADVKKTDLIIIPAFFDNQEAALEANKEFIPWILEQYGNGAEIASFCIGTFFLARTGLLNGKQCATHWRYANEFRLLFPEANLVDGKILTEDDRIYTSGGAYSYLNLLVYLIEKHAGREMAIVTAKSFMIDIDRSSQSPFMIFQGQKAHEDDEIKKAQEFIENNFEDRISVDQLADKFAIGRRSFERRLRKLPRTPLPNTFSVLRSKPPRNDLRPAAKTSMK